METQKTEQPLAKEKEEKYDRQLRLWGAHGQMALEKAKVCLINGGATGTEILKNLVLPGVGSFTIVDGNKVEAADLGNNFFLTFNDLGKSRAESATTWLKELNGWVEGNSLSEDPIKLIETNVDYFASFTLVIATELPETSLLKLAQFLYDKQVPLFVVRSYGFLGYLRVITPEHTVIESHPEEPVEDLRLYEPFPELVNFSNSIEIEKLDSHLHGHVPYIVILTQHLQKWRAENNGNSPTTQEDKNAFKLRIREASGEKDSNFPEAIAQAYRISSPTTIPSAVKAILHDPAAMNITANSSNYWILAAAVRQFVEANNGLLPLMGSIPDMTADTTSFLALSSVYQNKAKDDIKAVADNVAKIAASVGKPADAISLDEITLFCKSAQELRLVRTRSLAQEYSNADRDELKNSLDDNGKFYVLLRAVDRFFTAHGRFPGSENDNVLTDLPLLKEIVGNFLTEHGIEADAVKDDVIHEMCRYGASELHNIGAFLGGVVSQEAIKIITHQWVPLNGTFIFNGVQSTTSAFAF